PSGARPEPGQALLPDARRLRTHAPFGGWRRLRSRADPHPVCLLPLPQPLTRCGGAVLRGRRDPSGWRGAGGAQLREGAGAIDSAGVRVTDICRRGKRPMSYLAFHAVFILPPIVLLAWLLRRRRHRVHRRAGLFLLAVAAIAFVYTTPWDNYLVWRGVWGYGTDRVIATIGYVPVEEYLFFLLQPLLTGIWLYHLLPAKAHATGSQRPRWIGAALYGLIALLGVLLLRTEAGTYL